MRYTEIFSVRFFLLLFSISFSDHCELHTIPLRHLTGSLHPSMANVVLPGKLNSLATTKSTFYYLFSQFEWNKKYLSVSIYFGIFYLFALIFIGYINTLLFCKFLFIVFLQFNSWYIYAFCRSLRLLIILLSETNIKPGELNSFFLKHPE